MGIPILISLIVAAGLLGGAANYYMADATSKSFWKSILLGLTAAATVPLLLNTMSSDLTEKCVAGGSAAYSAYFVFFGFCTIAALFSSNFLQSLGDKVLQELKSVQEKQQEMAETTDALVSKNSDPAEPVAPVETPPAKGDDLESFNPNDPPKSPTVVLSDEQKVLAKLQSSQYAFRTAEGLAKDTGLDFGTVQARLLELESQGKVKKIKRANDGAMVWSLK